MANTYTQIHIQTVFAVKFRECLISPKWKDQLYRYMTGIIQNHGHKLLEINGMPDHVHIFFGMRPDQSLSKLMQHLKEDSAKWLNNQGYLMDKFKWQEGFGAFSYSRSQISSVCQYIRNQEQHHQKQTFLEEYDQFLRTFEVEFDERFIFKNPI